jgi:hypothetical protein
MEDKSFEIPDSLRELAQQNLRTAREAYAQFVAAARQAQGFTAESSAAMAATAKEIQSRLMQFAERNSEAGFSMANDLARARDLNEWFAKYKEHAGRQAESYAQQAQELGRLIAEAQRQV